MNDEAKALASRGWSIESESAKPQYLSGWKKDST